MCVFSYWTLKDKVTNIYELYNFIYTIIDMNVFMHIRE